MADLPLHQSLLPLNPNTFLENMIAKLKGIVDEIALDHVLVDVGGVCYLAYCSRRTLDSLSAQGGLGSHIILRTEAVYREDSQTLYGFASALEQSWFRLLTTVQGVGPKAALSILSALSPDRLYDCILAGDKQQLTVADGIGLKTAARIVTELADKAAKVLPSYIQTLDDTSSEEFRNTGAKTDLKADSSAKDKAPSKTAKSAHEKIPEKAASDGRTASQLQKDATSALVNLGYMLADSHRAVQTALQNYVAEHDTPPPLSDLIRLALRVVTYRE